MNINLNNTDLFFPLLGAFVAILGTILAIVGIGSWFKKGNGITTRLVQFVAAETKQPEVNKANPIILREISGSLFNRTIVNWVERFIRFLEKATPEKMAANLEHKLLVAGNPNNMHAGGFFAFRLVLLVGGGFLALLFNRDIRNLTAISVIIGLLIIALSFFLPVLWLNGQIKAKQYEIRRELPNALDMLSVCADAGMGFDQSLQKISLYWDTDLGHELKRVTQELEMGISRADALKNMSDRLDVEDLSRFISIIIQAELIGMSYAEVLHAQAQQMRVLRQYWAREVANKLPAKMIIPLALFIFPALIAVILGPTIPTILNIF
jgi:tight adherence protein C